MNVVILGGDGYLGWPTAMALSAKGHNICVVDNYLRRNLCDDYGAQPLFEVPDLYKRVELWKMHSGYDIDLKIGDLCDWDFVEEVFRGREVDAVIHYAEQPSAPFSMLDRKTAKLTLDNNLGVTGNLIFAIREFCPEAHMVKLGTMGEYGTPDIDIEEGWIDIEHKGRSDRFLYPRQAGSLYHTTKIMDTDLLWFYVRTWGLKVTDLMQGPVYGMFTDETMVDDQLLPFFNYDELFGTVVNRFVVQAVAGIPLSIYGRGGQTRGYLNIKDTINCVRLALENPPEAGELKIYNQFTETFSVTELADMIQGAGNKLGIDVEVQHMDNPRTELEEHYYNPAHTGLLELGLEPNYLSEDVLAQMMERVVLRRKHIDEKKIFMKVKWA